MSFVQFFNGKHLLTLQVLNQITSGGASVNDAYTHGSISTIAFGGVGSSGQGAYRGRTGFECFSHRRSVTTTPGWIESLLDVRYPPYLGKTEKYRSLNAKSPNFDREGKEVKSAKYWLSMLFGLGLGKKSGLLFWSVVVVATWLGKQKRGEVYAAGSNLVATLLK